MNNLSLLLDVSIINFIIPFTLIGLGIIVAVVIISYIAVQFIKNVKGNNQKNNTTTPPADDYVYFGDNSLSDFSDDNCDGGSDCDCGGDCGGGDCGGGD